MMEESLRELNHWNQMSHAWTWHHRHYRCYFLLGYCKSVLVFHGLQILVQQWKSEGGVLYRELRLGSSIGAVTIFVF